MTTELDVTAGIVGLTSTLVDRINALDERLARIERELSVQAEALNRLRCPEHSHPVIRRTDF